MARVDERIKVVTKLFTSTNEKIILQQNDSVDVLKDIHVRYLLTPTYKASAIIASLCKRYYSRFLYEGVNAGESADWSKWTYNKSMNLLIK